MVRGLRRAVPRNRPGNAGGAGFAFRANRAGFAGRARGPGTAGNAGGAGFAFRATRTGFASCPGRPGRAGNASSTGFAFRAGRTSFAGCAGRPSSAGNASSPGFALRARGARFALPAGSAGGARFARRSGSADTCSSRSSRSGGTRRLTGRAFFARAFFSVGSGRTGRARYAGMTFRPGRAVFAVFAFELREDARLDLTSAGDQILFRGKASLPARRKARGSRLPTVLALRVLCACSSSKWPAAVYGPSLLICDGRPSRWRPPSGRSPGPDFGALRQFSSGPVLVRYFPQFQSPRNPGRPARSTSGVGE